MQCDTKPNLLVGSATPRVAAAADAMAETVATEATTVAGGGPGAGVAAAAVPDFDDVPPLLVCLRSSFTNTFIEVTVGAGFGPASSDLPAAGLFIRSTASSYVGSPVTIV